MGLIGVSEAIVAALSVYDSLQDQNKDKLASVPALIVSGHYLKLTTSVLLYVAIYTQR